MAVSSSRTMTRGTFFARASTLLALPFLFRVRLPVVERVAGVRVMGTPDMTASPPGSFPFREAQLNAIAARDGHQAKGAALPLPMRQRGARMSKHVGTTIIAVNGLSFTADVAGLASGKPVLLLRGYSPGARPAGIDAYHIDLLIGDVLALADTLRASRLHLVARLVIPCLFDKSVSYLGPSCRLSPRGRGTQ